MIYLTNGVRQKQYTTINNTDDFNHLLHATRAPQQALNMTAEQLAEYKRDTAPYAIYGEVSGMTRQDDVINRTVLFIDVDDEGNYTDTGNRMGDLLRAFGTSFVIYPTISNGIKQGARLRVGVSLDRAVNVDEYAKVSNVLTKTIDIKGDTTAINQSFKQLQGLYVQTSQNSQYVPNIEDVAQGLPVDKVIEAYNANPEKYQEKTTRKQMIDVDDESSDIPKYAQTNRKIIACLLDPESNYMMFGGWDNMLTALGGWTLRNTYGNYRMTADVLEAVNNMGSDPIDNKELGNKFKSWAERWTY
ncbi:hypothetical protein ACFQGR_04590 [Weissella sagaensis]|uniref:Uncharacterized protein n=1 Tax=Weissella sagaensis TaxID=2559928 RepID=A0ABW1RT87_9LACO|nr:hypothetical protein [Weissella sagaensis]